MHAQVYQKLLAGLSSKKPNVHISEPVVLWLWLTTDDVLIQVPHSTLGRERVPLVSVADDMFPSGKSSSGTSAPVTCEQLSGGLKFPR